MKIVILVLVFVVLFGSLLAFFNFAGIYSAISTVGEFISQSVLFITSLVRGVIDAISDYYYVFMIVLLFVVLWFVETIFLHFLGGKK